MENYQHQKLVSSLNHIWLFIICMAYRTLLIISILVLNTMARAQLIQVRTYSDRKPIENVAVFNSTRERGTITDSLGMSDISIFLESDTIIFQHPSYETMKCMRSELTGQQEVLLQRKRIPIDEYVISVSEYRESSHIIPYKVDVLEEEQLKKSTGLTSADILVETGNIVVQKTQGGGGSPILRGFEANKVLLVVE